LKQQRITSRGLEPRVR